MRIAVMTDLEGVAGVVNVKDWIFADSRYYEKAKMLLTEETNAAIRGLFDAGADEVFVIDGHGPGAIDTLLLDERALYSRGWAVPGEFGMNDDFDAIIWVGQHAKAGTKKSHITHTGYFDVIDQKVNGISVGEYGEAAMIAGSFGYPAIFASGERALREEVMELTPWVHTVEVKYGVTLDDGSCCKTSEEYMEHNTGAVHVHPTVARKRIYEGAKAALSDFIANPEKFKVLKLEAPFTCERWYRSRDGKPPYKEISKHDTDIVKAIFFTGDNKETLPEGTYEMPY